MFKAAVKCFMFHVSHSQVRSIIARIYSGFEIKKRELMCLRRSAQK